MRVEQLGDGEPELAVVGGIHGDEPCGVRAIERLLADPPAVSRPVILVVANEPAIEQGVRYVDADLNRSFHNDEEIEAYEHRLARELGHELEGMTTLALHSTQSYPEPFAIVSGVDAFARSVCPRLSIDAIVDAEEFIEGRLFATGSAVEVECGLQGSDRAAENAYRVVLEFLVANDALPADALAEAPDAGGGPAARAADGTPVLRLIRPVAKPPGEEYEVFAENFRRVDAGEAFAAVDGDPLVAEEPFYPVLMSPYGYRDLFGYAAEPLGPLAEADDPDPKSERGTEGGTESRPPGTRR